MPARRWIVLGAVLAVLAGLGLAIMGYRNLGDPPIDGKVLGWGPTLDEHQLSVRFGVHRDHPERPATCTLRARARDGAEVGRADIAVPPGTSDVAVTSGLRISAPAVVAEVYSCMYR
jgi:uncharacterized protein DUF4307